jgi:N-methylhydantoinase A
MLFGDLRYDFVRSCFRRLASADFAEIEGLYAAMEAEGQAAIAGCSVTPEAVVMRRAADMRYVGQEHAVTVELPREAVAAGDREAIKRAFDAQHAIRYGTSAPGEPAELVSLRATVTGTMRKPPRHRVPAGGAEPEAAALSRRKPVYFNGRMHDTPVFARERLRAGNRIAGPALIEEHASTTVLQPGDALEVDSAGNLLIAIGSEAP